MSDYLEQHLQGDGIVVFGRLEENILRIASRPGWAAITGSTNSLTRAATLTMFGEGKLFGIALTYGGGSEGIRLRSAKKLILLDRHHREAVNLQAEARVGPECEIIRM